MRHPFVVLCLLAGLFALPARAQWLETTIYLPDTMTCLNNPTALVWNPANNQVYVGGASQYVIAVDVATNQKVARIGVQNTAVDFAVDATRNRIWCAGDENGDSVLTVIDGATNSVERLVGLFGWDPTVLCLDSSGAVYCADPYGDTCPIVSIIRHDSIEAVVPVPANPTGICYNAASGKVYCLCQTPDQVAVIQSDSVVKLINVGATPVAMLCNPAANKLYTADQGSDQVSIIDCALDSVIAAIPVVSEPAALTFNPTNNKVYCSTLSGDSMTNLVVIDAVADTVIALIPLSDGELGELTYNPANNTVYCADVGNGLLDAVDGAGDTVVAAIPIAGTIGLLTCSPVSNRVYAVDLTDRQLVAIDGATNQVMDLIALGSGPGAMAYYPNLDKAYCADDVTSSLYVIDCTQNTITRTLATGRSPRATACYPERAKVYTADYLSSSVSVFDCVGDSLLATVATGAYPWALSCNPAHDKVYAANRSGNNITIISGSGDSLLMNLPVGRRPYALLYDSAGDKLYCPCTGPTRDSLFVIDGASDSILAQLYAGREPRNMVFDPADRKLYVAARTSDSIKVYDAVGNVFLRNIRSYNAPEALCYSPLRDRVYCANYSTDDVTVIDCALDSVIALVPGVSGHPTGLYYNSRDDRIYCLNGTSVAVIDGNTNAVVTSVAVGLSAHAFAWSPVSNRTYVSNRNSASISVLRDSLTGVAEGIAPSAARPTLKLLPSILRGRAQVRFSLARAGRTRLTVYDAGGRLVQTLFEQPAAKPGVYQLTWNCRDRTSRSKSAGIYFLRLETPAGTLVDKALLLK